MFDKEQELFLRVHRDNSCFLFGYYDFNLDISDAFAKLDE